MLNDRSFTSTASVTGALKILSETGLRLASERNLDRVLQTTLDAGLQLTDASFGAFFHAHPLPTAAEANTWRAHLAGSAAQNPSQFPFNQPDDQLIHTCFGGGIRRHGDISLEAAFGPGTALAPFASGHSPMRSYFAIPVHDTRATLLGGMVYGHPDPHIFPEPIEPLLASVAAQAGQSIENIRLHERLTAEVNATGTIRQLQRETADRLARVFEATSDSVFLLDRHWRFTYLNPEAERTFARGRQLIGMTMTSAFPGAASLFADHYVGVMAGGDATEFTEFYETLGRWLSVKAYPTPDGVAVFVQDVTDERNAAREKAESERRLHQALDAAGLGTFCWDRATDALDLDNRAAQLFRTDPNQPISRSELRSHLLSSDDQTMTFEALETSVATGSPYRTEYRLPMPNGKPVWLAANGIPTFSKDTGEVTGMVGTVQDVTDRKSQEAALRQSEKLAATGRLAATIAHEINNPLEAVTNLIYLVKTDPTVPSPAQQLLETADAELARVAQIAQQTLGFYRDTTRPVLIDLGLLLRGVVDLFERKLTQKNIRCRLELDPNLRVFGLQGELRQVFSNLIVNAIDATGAPQPGAPPSQILIRARLRTSRGVNGIAVLLCDQGTGVPPAIRKQLFAPFFTTKQAVGTGLGLWVTRGMLEKQLGSIHFGSSSVAPSGTVFRVFLPVSTQILERDTPLSTVIQ